MDFHIGISLGAALLAAVLGFATAGFISNDALLEHGHDGTGRSLLQATKVCPVNFKDANYTVITSRCKGLLYQPSVCCNALKEFACPYSAYINDPSSSCAATMFSYITIYGKYPPGLFSSTCCQEDKGLNCAEEDPQIQQGKEEDSSGTAAAPSAAAALTAGVAALLLMSW